MSDVRLLLRDFIGCLRYAPVAVLALAIYLALPTTAIFPPDYDAIVRETNWHPSWLGWCDLLLLVGILLTWAARRVEVGVGTLVVIGLSLVVIVLSLVLGSRETDLRAAGDALVAWTRFVLVFVFATDLARRKGHGSAEALFAVLFVVLCTTSLAVYSLQFEKFSRIYASAMTVASFSQAASVVAFIALARRNYPLLVLSLAFLALTFSLTSILLFLGLWSVWFIVSRVQNQWHRVASFCLIGTVMLVTWLVTRNSPNFELVYDTLDPRTYASLHGRTPIYAYALEEIAAGEIGPFGVGFHQTPSLLKRLNVRTDDGRPYRVRHFHSIALEYFLGLGLPSLLLLGVLLHVIRQSWQWQCYPGALIFSFFFLSQCLDYTFYHPKELIVWALALGVAEGQRQAAASRARRHPGPAELPVTAERTGLPGLLPGRA